MRNKSREVVERKHSAKPVVLNLKADAINKSIGLKLGKRGLAVRYKDKYLAASFFDFMA